MLEVLTVIALVGIASAVAVVQMRTTMTALDADAASSTVVSQLNYARQLAVDQRRNVLVEFLSTNRIKITRDPLGTPAVMADVTLPSGYAFGLPSGVPDTPDGFNPPNGAAVYFNAGTGGTFLGDGTFVDNSNVLVNGSVSTIYGGNGTARAVTLSGATGRIKQWWVQGTTWVVR